MQHDALILFTRWPEPGKAKTRLISSLGAEGAAELHRRMTLQSVGRAWAFCMGTSTALTIAHEGGTEAQMRAWLGPLLFEKQTPGDLGVRMSRAALAAHARGARKIVIIGSDCPELDESHLRSAFDMLETTDLVLGPVSDGGYCLIAFKEIHLGLFQNIAWSTDSVFAETMRCARTLNLRVATLPTLKDIDEPSDIAHAESALARGHTVSVIIPTLNDAQALHALLPQVISAKPHEIIVADGGSTDAINEVVSRYAVRLIASPRGRAMQMNHGAANASGEFLLFLHADTSPPDGFTSIITRTLTQIGVAAGAFRFRLHEPIAGRRLIETLTQLRCNVLQNPYGDQGLYVRRSLFQSVGGFPEWPLLEDVEIVHRLRRLGRISISSEVATTSARRWITAGIARTFLRHQIILAGHAMGVPTEKLATLR